MVNLSTPLIEIPGIGPRFISKLKRLDIDTVGALLYHFPSRYEDYSERYNISDLEPGQQASIQGVVRDVELRRTWQRHLVIVEANIEDNTGTIRAVWFNQPYIKNILQPGRLANFAGKVSVTDGEIYLSHPTYEIVNHYGDQETKHTNRLVPVYPETRGLTSKGIRFLVQPILKNLEQQAEFIPEEILDAQGLPEINAAINGIHFPEKIDEALLAKKRFAFEDLFLLQAYNLQLKSQMAKQNAPAIKVDVEDIKAMMAKLPFELTLSQKKSLWEAIQDMEKDHPMNRLLQGDVGSGKTVVAALAALVAAQAGFQTALMAPTEVLANQHYHTLKKLFANIGGSEKHSIGLLTGTSAKIFFGQDLETDIKKVDFAKRIKSGAVNIIIGTHALIQKNIDFKKLGLVIIDEQHRFGVEQRAKLTSHNKKTIPHFLSMSATPIPRTLMLTVFGDLDISTINELPKGRKPIITKVIDPVNRPKAYGFIKQQIDAGRQAFVICPRIDIPDADEAIPKKDYWKQRTILDTKSVKEEYEKLSKKIFPNFKVAMLHGQMKSAEKEKIMKEFKDGRIDILVSTSVIEVGVDVPNATIMMIEGSDRFGLAQLYQFRGRVGRGEHQSFCFLFTDSKSKTAAERLKAIVQAKNGFELAEVDLKLRGPGEFLGQKQTGLPDVAMRGLQDFEMIKESRDAAAYVISRDPSLIDHPELLAKLTEFRKRIHFE